MSTKYIQSNTQYLAGSGVIIGATSIVLTSLTDIYGNDITNISQFGDKGFITLEPDTNNEESATFTGITVNANGTVTLSGVKTTLAQSPYTETAGLIRNHSGGTKVVITDNVAFWNTFTNKSNDETITGAWSVPEPTQDAHIATKKYADDLAYISGSPNMNLTTKGIGEEATQAEIDAGTQTGSTSAELVVNPKYLKDSIYYTQLPSANQKAALAGTGTPSATDVFVNQSTITGMITMWGGAAAPTGWVLCDGSSLLRAGTYANLFAIIGTTYGSADGTHFNVPDLRGRVAVGKSSDTEFDTLGETGGEKTHQLTTAELAAHTHATDVYTVGGSSGGTWYAGSTLGNLIGSPSTGSAGSGTAHNNLQPYITLNYIIKY